LIDTLARMVPFTREVLLRQVQQYDATVWPAQIAVLVIALAVVWAVCRPFRGSGRLVAALLAAAWIWTGVGYHMLAAARIDWAAWFYGFLFLIEGLLLLLAGVLRSGLAFRFVRGAAGWGGLAFIAAGFLLYPAAAFLGDIPWPRLMLPGLYPGATVLFTLGLLLLTEGRTPWHLLIVPLLWTIAAAGQALVLDMPQHLALPAAALVAIILAAWKNRGVGHVRSDI